MSADLQRPMCRDCGGSLSVSCSCVPPLALPLRPDPDHRWQVLDANGAQVIDCYADGEHYYERARAVVAAVNGQADAELAARLNAETITGMQKHVRKLESQLARLLQWIEQDREQREIAGQPFDYQCPHCTLGEVPGRADAVLCAYHDAKGGAL